MGRRPLGRIELVGPRNRQERRRQGQTGSARRLGSRSIAAILGTAILGTSGGGYLASPASAYPEATNNCSDATMTFRFVGSWSETNRDRVRSGILLWNFVRREDGLPIVAISETTGTPDVELKLANLPSGTYATAECSLGASISFDAAEINGDPSDDARSWRTVARHEIGHLAGLEHSGHQDSRNGDNRPTMSTCGTRQDQKFDGLSQDDQAYLNWVRRGQTSHANVGFEEGLSFWGKSSPDDGLISESTGGTSGPGVARFKAASVSGLTNYVFQTVDMNNASTPDFVTGLMNHRKISTDHGGNARVAVFSRRLNHSGSSNCSYPFGMVPNSPSEIDSVYVLRGGATQGVTSSWQLGQTGGLSMPSAEGHRVQIRVYTDLRNQSNEPQYLTLDNVRVDSNN